MNTLRKLIGFVFVAAFALASGAAVAADKQYILTVAASAALPQPAFTFTFTNDGNSSFNALQLNLPSGWSVSAAGGVTSSRGTATFTSTARNVIYVQNINLPNGAGQSMTVTVTGVTGGASTCGSAQSGDWTAQPWTGSSVGSGQIFSPKTPFSKYPYPVSTQVPASCFTVTSSSSDTAKGNISPLTQSVNAGGSAQFTIAPVTGYHWTTPGGTCPAGTLNGLSYSTGAINANCTVIANFAIDTFTVSTSFDATKGSISPTSRTDVQYNSTTSFTVAPLSGFHVTGVSGCGGTWDQNVGGSTYTTGSITQACTVSATFAANTLTVTLPNAYINTPFDVSVAYDGAAPANLNLSWTCSSGDTGSQTKSSPPASSPTTFSVTLTKYDSCTFTASDSNYASGSASLATVYTGDLGCTDSTRKAGTLDPSALKTYVQATDQGKWGLLRGSNKPNSDSCVPVPYIFELDVLSPRQQSRFIVPDPSVAPKQGVSAKYTVVWGRFDVVGDASNIWGSKRPNVSWGIANPVAGSNDFVPALPCVMDPDNPDLKVSTSTPYYPNGFVSVPTADLDKLLPVIPDVAPFNTYSATDTRHSQYKYDGIKKAKMCIAQQGWTATGTDESNPLTGTPTTVQIWTSVIDQGDGYMNLE